MEMDEQKSILKKLRKLDPCLCVKYESSFFDKEFHSFGDFGTWVHAVRVKRIFLVSECSEHFRTPFVKAIKSLSI